MQLRVPCGLRVSGKTSQNRWHRRWAVGWWILPSCDLEQKCVTEGDRREGIAKSIYQKEKNMANRLFRQWRQGQKHIAPQNSKVSGLGQGMQDGLTDLGKCVGVMWCLAIRLSLWLVDGWTKHGIVGGQAFWTNLVISAALWRSLTAHITFQRTESQPQQSLRSLDWICRALLF